MTVAVTSATRTAAAPEWLAAGSEVLYREALYLDTLRWDEWLELFEPDCEYWVPAWKSEHQPTSNPKRELSLIYYATRGGLEDRVWRARSGKSAAATPLPRTHHVIGNVLLDEAGPERLKLLSVWTAHQYRTKLRETELLYGRYEHELVLRDGAWRIAKKKILLLNDTMPAMVDFYSL